jgi:arabinose-5-phosphate isomerase
LLREWARPWLVGKKISATLASTGTPSFDLHAGEALHGDLGRIRPGDVVIALSNSGRTREVVELVEALKRIRVSLIAITGARGSALAENSDCVLSIGDLDEACPLRLAPSTTTTAMLALGDALALTVQRARNFTPEDYAFFHPAGSLGRKLMKVAEIMRTGDDAPVISEQAEVRVAIVETSRSRAGAISVVDESGRLVGIFTNGDLRRHFGQDLQLGARRMNEVMTRKPKTTSPERLVAEVHAVLKEHRIDELPVIDREGRPVGMVDIQDLLRLDR